LLTTCTPGRPYNVPHPPHSLPNTALPPPSPRKDGEWSVCGWSPGAEGSGVEHALWPGPDAHPHREPDQYPDFDPVQWLARLRAVVSFDFKWNLQGIDKGCVWGRGWGQPTAFYSQQFLWPSGAGLHPLRGSSSRPCLPPQRHRPRPARAEDPDRVGHPHRDRQPHRHPRAHIDRRGRRGRFVLDPVPSRSLGCPVVAEVSSKIKTTQFPRFFSATAYLQAYAPKHWLRSIRQTMLPFVFIPPVRGVTYSLRTQVLNTVIFFLAPR